jgi:hypothetical protein
MKFVGAFDHGVDQDDPENDRFTTNWKGPYDPRAIVHAAKKGISYDHGGGSACMKNPILHMFDHIVFLGQNSNI